MIKETLAPLAHELRSIQARDWSLHGSLAELIDNSASKTKGCASNIVIDLKFDTDEIVYMDDGVGADDINRLFQIGNTTSWQSDDIGLFGVGGTHACIWLADQLIAENLRDDGVYQWHTTDWADCIEEKRWPYRYETERDDFGLSGFSYEGFEFNHGISYSMTNLRKGLNRSRIAVAERELARMFTPGLRNGLKIHIRKNGGGFTLLEPQVPASLEQEMTKHGSITNENGDRLDYVVRAGILKEHSEEWNVTRAAFGHRFICHLDVEKDLQSGLFYCDVSLASANWKYCLSDHKSEIISMRDELEDAVHEDVREMLKAATQTESDIVIEDMVSQLNRTLASSGIKLGVGGESKGGGSGIGPDPDPQPGPDPEIEIDPQPGDDLELNGTPEDDEDSEETVAKNKTGIAFRMVSGKETGHLIAISKIGESHITVLINKEDEKIKTISQKPVNELAVWAIAMGLVASCLVINGQTGAFVPSLLEEDSRYTQANDASRVQILTDFLLGYFPVKDRANKRRKRKKAK